MVNLLSVQIYVVYILLILKCCVSFDEVCDRRPLGTKSMPLPPDNQFVLDIEGIRDDQYIPKNQYEVHLHSRDEKSTFIAFTISLREDSVENKLNPRRPTYLLAGTLVPLRDSRTVKFHPHCNNTVMESDITAKTSVRALWTAPDKDNKCVTIFAVVAIKSNVWYSFEGPLSKRVCEDPRKDDDIPPMENDDCQVCEDARYMLTFEGLWSYNTHPTTFPIAQDLARFSDIVGASHRMDFSVYTFNSIASLGLKMLAEQGNTTQLEIEIESELVSKVRTVIKATSPPQPNMTTLTTFRANKDYHRLSIVTAILPSPDWFLGVSNLELCDAKTKEWAPGVRLNLYPLDAGTDKGLTFEKLASGDQRAGCYFGQRIGIAIQRGNGASPLGTLPREPFFGSPNEETSPQQPISRAEISRKIGELSKPFARLQLTLVRTYSTPGCVVAEDTHSEGDDREIEGNEGDIEDHEYKPYEPESSVIVYKPPKTPTTTTSEEPLPVDPESSDKCPMTQWEEWLPCEGECIDNTVQGVQIRFRYHMVDGVPVGKYVENAPYEEKEIPQECLDDYPDSETRECEEPCENEAVGEEDEYNAEQDDSTYNNWRIWKRK